MVNDRAFSLKELHAEISLAVALCNFLKIKPHFLNEVRKIFSFPVSFVKDTVMVPLHFLRTMLLFPFFSHHDNHLSVREHI